MRAAQVITPKKPLQIRDLNTPVPKGRQVIVKVLAAGVCHSDIHIWEGGYEGTKGEIMKVEERTVKFPPTLGNEIAGTVDAVGGDVMGFRRGDQVLVYPWIGDGTCPACQVGDEQLCDNPKSIGIFQQGGYADKVVVPDYKYLVSIDKLDANAACSLACSGLTAYTAVKNASTSPKQTMVIIGVGGLGLMAIQIARTLLNPSIIAVDIDDKKLREARKLGADYTVNSRKGDPVNQVKDLTKGIGPEAVLDFVNAPKTAEPGINMLRKRGKLVLVGLFGGTIELNLPLIPLRSYSIIGSYTGRLADLHDLVDLVRRGAVNPIVARTFTLSQANEALVRLKEGKIIGRTVLKP